MIATALELFLRRELLSKRTVFLTVACLLPAVLAGAARAFSKGGFTFFDGTASTIYLAFLAVLVPVFHAVAAFHEEFEQRTIVYLLTRPPTRRDYVVAKFLAAWACSAFSIVVGIAATAIVCGVGGSVSLGQWIEFAGKLAVSCTLACGVYSAFFLLFGLWFKNPVLWGLVITFGWENVVRLLPGTLRNWTIGIYTQSFFIHWADAEPDIFGYESSAAPAASPFGGGSGLSGIARMLAPELTLPTLWWSLAMMVFVAAGALVLAVAIFRRREDA